jgi:hypothetical protein
MSEGETNTNNQTTYLSKMFSPEKIGLFLQYSQKNIFVFVVLAIIIAIIYLSSSYSQTNLFYFYIFIILLTIMSSIFYFFPIYFHTITIISIIVFIIILYSYTNINVGVSSLLYSNGLFTIISFFIAVVGLALLYRIFKQYLSKQNGWSGFFIQLFFYIPCLLTDFIEYQYDKTPNTAYILLVSEICLILLYFYLPKLINKIMVSSNGNKLLDKPIFINTEITVANDETFRTKNNKPRENYAFSIWTYVNPQQSSYLPYSGESPIFNYGNGIWTLYYSNDSQNGKYKIKTKTQTNTIVEFDAPNQKWNNLVFNIDNGQIDVFVNGKLIETAQFLHQESVTTNNIIIGKDSGIYGAICNIHYYANPLTKYEIVNMYQLLMYRNPPTE